MELYIEIIEKLQDLCKKMLSAIEAEGYEGGITDEAQDLIDEVDTFLREGIDNG